MSVTASLERPHRPSHGSPTTKGWVLLRCSCKECEVCRQFQWVGNVEKVPERFAEHERNAGRACPMAASSAVAAPVRLPAPRQPKAEVPVQKRRATPGPKPRCLTPAQVADVRALMAAGLFWLGPADRTNAVKQTPPNEPLLRYRTVVCALASWLTGAPHDALAGSMGLSVKQVRDAVRRMPRLLAGSLEARRMAAVLGSQFHVRFPLDWPPCGIVEVDDSLVARRLAERNAAQHLRGKTVSQARDLCRYLVAESGLTAEELQQSGKRRHVRYRRLVAALVLRVPGLVMADACDVLGDLVASYWSDVKVQAWAAEVVHASMRMRRIASEACDRYGLAWPDDWPARPTERQAASKPQPETLWQEYESQRSRRTRVLEYFQLVAEAAGVPVDDLKPRYRHLAIGFAAENGGFTELELRQLLDYQATRVITRSRRMIPDHLARSADLSQVAVQVASQLGMELPLAWQRPVRQAQDAIDRLWQIFDEVGRVVDLTGRELAAVETRHGVFNQHCQLAAALAVQLPGLVAGNVNKTIGRSVSYTNLALESVPGHLAESADWRRLARAVADRHQLVLPAGWPLTD
jgi:hypothetical protein